MPALGTLYSFPENYNSKKVEIAAKFAGTEIEISSNFVFGKTNKTKEFKEKFPIGKVPAFETNTEPKVYLTEGNAIAYYVANNKLRGVNDLEKAQVIQWMNFTDAELMNVINALTLPIINKSYYVEEIYAAAECELQKLMKALESRLESYTYLVNEYITLADISVFCCVIRLFQKYFEENFCKEKYPCTWRWFNTMLNQPEIKTFITNFSYCQVKECMNGELLVSSKEDQKKQSTFKEQKNQDNKGSKKEKETERPTKEKKSKVKVEKDENVIEEEEAPVKEKPSPFAALPKGTFSMNEFKSLYSNKETKEALDGFWSTFDPECYSIWFSEYKYPEELRKVFMTCNLVSGMFQRLDKMRDQSLGSVCIFGSDNNSSISGVWIWRGQDLAFKLSPDWQVDYESYDWKKLDHKVDSDKKLIEEYLGWTCATDKDGRQFNQGKIFK